MSRDLELIQDVKNVCYRGLSGNKLQYKVIMQHKRRRTEQLIRASFCRVFLCGVQTEIPTCRLRLDWQNEGHDHINADAGSVD